MNSNTYDLFSDLQDLRHQYFEHMVLHKPLEWPDHHARAPLKHHKPDGFNLKQFWDEYCEYALSCVSISLGKAQQTLEYLNAIESHPDYDFKEFSALGDPVTRAAEVMSEHLLWSSEQLNSDRFFQIKFNPELEAAAAELSDAIDVLRSEMAPVNDRLIRQGLLLHLGELPSKEPSNVVYLHTSPQNQRIYNAVHEYQETSGEQLEAHIDMTRTRIFAFASGMQHEKARVTGYTNLRDDFIKVSMDRINRQYAQLDWLKNNNAVVVENDRVAFPLLSQQALDFHL